MRSTTVTTNAFHLFARSTCSITTTSAPSTSAAYAYLAPSDGGLEAFERLWVLPATPVEKAAMVARIEAICATLNPEQLQRAYQTYRAGPTWVIAASQLAIRADAAGDATLAAKLRAEVADVRAKLGLSRTIGGGEAIAPGGGNPGLLGAVVPLGTQNRIADAAVAGLGLAAGAPNGTGIAAIEVRPAGDKAEGEHAIDDLAGKNVIAIIGPIEGAIVDAAGGRAEGLGVPMISLATAADQRIKGRFVFHIRHSAEARARTLAQRALAKGIKDIRRVRARQRLRQSGDRGVRRSDPEGRWLDHEDRDVPEGFEVVRE